MHVGCDLSSLPLSLSSSPSPSLDDQHSVPSGQTLNPGSDEGRNWQLALLASRLDQYDFVGRPRSQTAGEENAREWAMHEYLLAREYIVPVGQEYSVAGSMRL